MKETIIDKKGELDVLDWIVFGKHYSRNGEEETAFQCFYMAHLLDHEKILTNSDLAFDTISAPNVNN